MRKFLFGLIVAIFALPAAAQTASECDWRASAQALAEPWEANSRTFANGAMRVALLDTVEPAAGSYHILVLSPPYTELGDRQCRVISFQDTFGFAGIQFQDLTASYDPAIGLTFQLPVYIYLFDQGFSNAGLLKFSLNQATGRITFYPVKWAE